MGIIRRSQKNKFPKFHAVSKFIRRSVVQFQMKYKKGNTGYFSFSGSKFFCFSTLSRKARRLLLTSSASEGVDPVGVSKGRRVPSLLPLSSRIEPGILERRAALWGGAAEEGGSNREEEGGANREEEGGPAEEGVA